MSSFVMKCINCGGVNLTSVSIETLARHYRLVGNFWSATKEVPMEHESWKVHCEDCLENFDEQELYEVDNDKNRVD